MSALHASRKSALKSAVSHWAEEPQQLLHRLLRPPLSIRSSLFLAVGLFLLLEAADVAICAASPCEFFSVGSKEALLAGECVEEYELILTIKLVGYLLCLLLAALHVFGRAVLAVRMSGVLLGRWKLQNTECVRAAHSAWVCVASPDLYAEVVASLRASNILIGLTAIPVTAVLMGVHISGAIEKLHGHEYDEVVEVCGPSELCWAGKSFNGMFEAFVLQVWAAVTVQFVTTPSILWGPAMGRAFQLMGHDNRRSRLARIPYLVIFSLAAITYMNVHLFLTELSDDTAYDPEGARQRGILFLTSLLCVLVHVGITWNSMLVQDTFTFLVEGARQLWATIQPSRLSDDDAPADALRVLREASCGYQRDQAMMLFLISLCYRVVSAVPIATAVVIYAARVVLALLIICLHDAEAGFHNLVHDSSSGFGLVRPPGARTRDTHTHTHTHTHIDTNT